MARGPYLLGLEGGPKETGALLIGTSSSQTNVVWEYVLKAEGERTCLRFFKKYFLKS